MDHRAAIARIHFGTSGWWDGDGRTSKSCRRHIDRFLATRPSGAKGHVIHVAAGIEMNLPVLPSWIGCVAIPVNSIWMRKRKRSVAWHIIYLGNTAVSAVESRICNDKPIIQTTAGLVVNCKGLRTADQTQYQQCERTQ